LKGKNEHLSTFHLKLLTRTSNKPFVYEELMNERVVDLSVPIEKLPAWVWILSLVLLVAPLVPYGLVYGGEYVRQTFEPLPLLLACIVLIVLHEAVHGIGWKVAGRLPWSAISFGFQWKTASPYCHASVPMLVNPYRIGAVLPLIITGILPYVVGFVAGNTTLTVAGTFLISAAVGDIYVLWTLRDVPPTAKVQDHEKNAGCVVYLEA
jgi:hypothetical protein